MFLNLKIQNQQVTFSCLFKILFQLLSFKINLCVENKLYRMNLGILKD